MIVNRIIENFGEWSKLIMRCINQIEIWLDENILLSHIIQLVGWVIIILIGFKLIFWIIGKYTGNN